MVREQADETDALRRAALDDLQRSGLDKKDFKALKLEILLPADTKKLVGEAVGAYKIPYFEADGRINGYYRVRALTNKKGKFAKLAGAWRYSQPANSAPHAYFPPYADWEAICKDASIPITITEGEKKAALATKLGIPTIALGGVWSFKASKRGQSLLPQLEKIEWKGRVVEICYDSDVMWKADVRRALDGLSYELLQHAPKLINRVFLDGDKTDGKVALDDYLVAHGAKAYRKLPREPYKPNEQLRQLNERIAFIDQESGVFDLTHNNFIPMQSLKVKFANVGSVVIDEKGLVEPLINLWLRSPERREHRTVIYQPGAPRVTADNDLNVWISPAITPVDESPDLWLDLVHYVMGKEDYAEWFLRWLAYPLQHPGTKLLTACFVWGQAQGVGKTFIVDPIMEFIYEKNFHRVTGEELSSNFNSYVAKHQFIYGDEVYLPNARDRRSFSSMLKSMITREKVSINEKFQPRVTYTDYANYYLTSNHADAIPLEEQDRRFFVIHAPEEAWDRAKYKRLDSYIRKRDGAARILHYLQQLDLGDFDPKDPAPRTAARAEVTKISANHVQDFVRRLRDEAPIVMRSQSGRLPELQLWRAADLLTKLEQQAPGSTRMLTETQLAHQLRIAGIVKRKVRANKHAPQVSLYAVLDADKWADRSNADWAAHYAQHSSLFAGEKP